MPSILILEDDITFSLMLKTWLGRKGFEVSSVSSVSDARSRIEDASFDLILSDLRLPDGDGIDLLKWIKDFHKGMKNRVSVFRSYSLASLLFLL